jgi:hypothetical protein
MSELGPYICICLLILVPAALLFCGDISGKLNAVDSNRHLNDARNYALKELEEHPLMAISFLTSLYIELTAHELEVHAKSFFRFLRNEAKMSNGKLLNPPARYNDFVRQHSDYNGLEWKHVVKIHDIVAKYFVDHPEESVKFMNAVPPVKLLAIRSLDPNYEEPDLEES